MQRPVLVLALLLAACRADAPDSSGRPAVPAAAAAVPVNTGENVFDAGAIQPGDTVLGLTVESSNVERVLDDSIWVGDVEFAGDLVVQGVYQPHPDWPQVTLPCFDVSDPGSAVRVPRFAPDDRTTKTDKTWFCFDEPDVALQLLGPPDPPREMVIAVDHYHVRRHLSDAYDTAELMEVIETGGTARRTLREP